MFLCKYHDFQSIYYCHYEQIDSCFVSQGIGSEQTSVEVGNFVAVLLQIYLSIYVCQK